MHEKGWSSKQLKGRTPVSASSISLDLCRLNKHLAADKWVRIRYWLGLCHQKCKRFYDPLRAGTIPSSQLWYASQWVRRRRCTSLGNQRTCRSARQSADVGPTWGRTRSWVWWSKCRTDVSLSYAPGGSASAKLFTGGFSPVWIRKCISSLEFTAKPLPQISHLYGHSPVWIRIWDLRTYISGNRLLQILHLNGLSPVWVRRCTLKWDIVSRVSKQILHS